MTESGLPDFLIIGAPRAGTTTLYDLLGRVGGIAMSRIKEPRFFSRCVDPTAFFSGSVTSSTDYRDLWRDAGEGDLRGEASPVYLHDPGTPAAVAEFIPEAKLIVSLRDPVDRAVSHWRYHELRTGRSNVSFADAFERGLEGSVSDYHSTYITAPGFYARNLKRWLDFFPRERIHIVVFEEMVRDPLREVGEIASFLGVEAPSSSTIGRDAVNSLRVPRSRWSAALMQWSWARTSVRALRLQGTAGRLAERVLTKPVSRGVGGDPAGIDLARAAYAGDVAELRRLLGRDLPWYPSAGVEG